MSLPARKLDIPRSLPEDSAEDDPVLAAFLRAPIDTRAETDAERAAIEEAKASRRRVAHDEVVAAVERWRSAG